ncbi:hypothetical protein CANCADRAFT_104620 [Tortispora caseinolytica NRRL Y-17796]|uniref:C2H2-type domain-containing protein n=1 Tax=Tortispora caseinolytica NRRL Y-17796 TaxID=767744 RepID=A0A1E4TES1_9ASCO|nr:hypothetical protein CANCADRAFT_104620 [Tortispora caseinolytica NRRL Y-17796]
MDEQHLNDFITNELQIRANETSINQMGHQNENSLSPQHFSRKPITLRPSLEELNFATRELSLFNLSDSPEMKSHNIDTSLTNLPPIMEDDIQLLDIPFGFSTYDDDRISHRHVSVSPHNSRNSFDISIQQHLRSSGMISPPPDHSMNRHRSEPFQYGMQGVVLGAMQEAMQNRGFETEGSTTDNISPVIGSDVASFTASTEVSPAMFSVNKFPSPNLPDYHQQASLEPSKNDEYLARHSNVPHISHNARLDDLEQPALEPPSTPHRGRAGRDSPQMFDSPTFSSSPTLSNGPFSPGRERTFISYHIDSPESSPTRISGKTIMSPPRDISPGRFNGELDTPAIVQNYLNGPNSEGKYSCKYEGCLKVFNRRYNAVSHIKTHLEYKPHVCHDCGVAFVRHHDLIRHERIHKEDKPYKCPCGKTFVRQDACIRHRARQICKGGMEVPKYPKSPRKNKIRKVKSMPSIKKQASMKELKGKASQIALRSNEDSPRRGKPLQNLEPLPPLPFKLNIADQHGADKEQGMRDGDSLGFDHAGTHAEEFSPIHDTDETSESLFGQFVEAYEDALSPSQNFVEDPLFDI